MMVNSDITAIIQRAQADAHHRTVIMNDVRTGVYIAAPFDHGYDEHASPEAVQQMFDASYQTLVTASQQVFNASTLPIVQFLGRFKVTKVTKLANGSVVVNDAVSAPVEQYVGME